MKNIPLCRLWLVFLLAGFAQNVTALAASLNPESGKAFENTLGMKFVPVPGTSVLFSIWDTRVQDYEAFVNETHREWPKADFPQGPTHPVVAVNWNDAQAFCFWLTQKERQGGRLRPDQEYRLPTDAEWSVAAGLPPEAGATPEEKDGKIKDVYSWGAQLPPPRGAGNFADVTAKRKHSDWSVIEGYDDGFADTSPVGSFPANKFGLYDMGGNVWQWCGEGWYSDEIKWHVWRGGSYAANPSLHLLLSARYGGRADQGTNDLGFRCVVGAVSSAGVARGETFENTLGMRFVPVPGTDVWFSIWDTRVQDYEAFMNEAFVKETHRKWEKVNFSQGPKDPAVNVSWDDARAFCAWLNVKERLAGRLRDDQCYRLPTDAEWSEAAGLPKETGHSPFDKWVHARPIADTFPWGKEWPPPRGAGNYADATLKREYPEVAPEGKVIEGYYDGFSFTSPVGSFAANKFGLYDLSGNVMQWCEDAMDLEFQDYVGKRVLRGCSFVDGGHKPEMLFLAFRHGEPPDKCASMFGFRVVLASRSSAR